MAVSCQSACGGTVISICFCLDIDMTKAVVRRCIEPNIEGRLHMDNINHGKTVLLEMYLNISTDLEHQTHWNGQPNLEH